MRADPKKHKRTPSFTTRRRTQSFRRHTKNLNTMENLPPVEVDGFLDRKQVQSCSLLIRYKIQNNGIMMNQSSGASIRRKASNDPILEELLHSPLRTADVFLQVG